MTDEGAGEWNLEVGRFELHDCQGKVILLDSCTGTMWVLKHLDTKPVLVMVSSQSKGGAE